MFGGGCFGWVGMIQDAPERFEGAAAELAMEGATDGLGVAVRACLDAACSISFSVSEGSVGEHSTVSASMFWLS